MGIFLILPQPAGQPLNCPHVIALVVVVFAVLSARAGPDSPHVLFEAVLDSELGFACEDLIVSLIGAGPFELARQSVDVPFALDVFLRAFMGPKDVVEGRLLQGHVQRLPRRRRIRSIVRQLPLLHFDTLDQLHRPVDCRPCRRRNRLLPIRLLLDEHQLWLLHLLFSIELISDAGCVTEPASLVSDVEY